MLYIFEELWPSSFNEVETDGQNMVIPFAFIVCYNEKGYMAGKEKELFYVPNC